MGRKLDLQERIDLTVREAKRLGLVHAACRVETHASRWRSGNLKVTSMYTKVHSLVKLMEIERDR